MTTPVQAKVLMEAEDITITTRQVKTPGGEYPFKDIRGVSHKVKQPVLGPVLLGLLGTIVLAVAFDSGFWLDLVASAIMLGGGVYWWLRGKGHVLILTTHEGDLEVWIARREAELRQAVDIIQERLDKREAAELSA